MTELFVEDGTSARVTLLARQNGQHMAALPCALAVQALCDSTRSATGAMTAYEFLGAETLIAGLQQAGYELIRETEFRN
jgi:hypothetical protein